MRNGKIIKKIIVIIIFVILFTAAVLLFLNNIMHFGKTEKLVLDEHIKKIEVVDTKKEPGYVLIDDEEQITKLQTLIGDLELVKVKKEENSRDNDCIILWVFTDGKGKTICIIGNYLFFHPDGYDCEYVSYHIKNNGQRKAFFEYLENLF